MKKIHADNCVRMLSIGDLFSCVELKQSAKRMVEHKFSVVYRQEAFLQLSHELLVDVLSSDNLNVEKVATFLFILCLHIVVCMCIFYRLSSVKRWSVPASGLNDLAS